MQYSKKGIKGILPKLEETLGVVDEKCLKGTKPSSC
jgi:hypothetical protein